MRIREAREEDLSMIAQIYNIEVLHGTSTFQTKPVDFIERKDWLLRHQRLNYPILVVDDLGMVRAWASLSPWSDRGAYQRAAEVSIYVHNDFQRRGIGKTLLLALIAEAKNIRIGVLLARVVTESERSLKLHRAVGFSKIGTMRRIGEKFGRILDIELLDLHLD